MPRFMVENIVLPTRIWMKMNKEDTIDFMIKSITDDWREMFVNAKMSEEDIEKYMTQNSQSVVHIVVNLYSRMKKEGLVV
jgi:hypothetical protein